MSLSEALPQENSPSHIKTAMELINKGQHREAAEFLIAFERQRLPDGHPSKDGAKGVLEGEAISQLSEFEEKKRSLIEKAAFSSAFIGFAETPMKVVNGVLTYFSEERPDLIKNFTDFMLRFNTAVEDRKPELDGSSESNTGASEELS